MRTEAEQHTYTVKELITEVQSSLKTQYPAGIWIEGMIQGYSEAPSGHTYFNLIEKTERPGDIPDYSISVAFFKLAKRNMPSDMQIENGMEVRIQGKAGLYPKRGNFQIIMSSIDAHYTISKLAENKEKLLANLRKEGLLELNRSQSLSILPLNIALITSKGSAAHEDFMDELRKSRFSWQITLIHTSVQGETAPAEIRAAFQAAAQLKIDAVALVRGGGSAIDLAAFDNDALARDIANFQMPVFCGIGHEINQSIVDLVVHTSSKTPTACARELIDIIENTQSKARALFQDVLTHATHFLRTEKSKLTDLTYRIAQAPTQRLQDAMKLLSSARTTLDISATQILKDSKRELAELQESLIVNSQKLLKDKKGQLDFIKNQISLLDPKKFLEKGWSITRTESGELVKNPEDIAPNTVIITQVSKGEIKSQTLEN